MKLQILSVLWKKKKVTTGSLILELFVIIIDNYFIRLQFIHLHAIEKYACVYHDHTDRVIYYTITMDG